MATLELSSELPKLTDWIQAVTGIVGMLISFVATIVAIFVLRQNTSVIKAAYQQLLLAIPPSVSITNPSPRVGDKFIIQNTSSYDLINIEIFVGKYATTAGNKPLKIESSYRGLYRHGFLCLKPLETIELEGRPLVEHYPNPKRTPENNTFNVISVRFSRAIDNQRFCHIHLFTAWIDDAESPPTIVMAMDGTPSSGGGGAEFINRSTKLVIQAERETLGFFDPFGA